MRRAIDDARAAFDSHGWGETYRLLSGLPVDDLSVEDLDRLATAAYLTGRDEYAFELWARAHRDCAQADEIEQAARFGLRLAQTLGFKGDIARSAGWVERVRRLLDDADIDCVELGYLAHGLGDVSTLRGGRPRRRPRPLRPGGQGRPARSPTASSSPSPASVRAGCSIYLGTLAEGMALLDEAMVSVEAGELSPIAIGDAYCTVIDACAELFDLARCRVWTESFSRWCDEHTRTSCSTGATACSTAPRSCRCTATGPMLSKLPAAPASAWPSRSTASRSVELTTLEGELHRLRGDFDAAEASYRRANEHGCDPQPGLALLRLAQGRTDTADATIRRVLGEAIDPISRARVLGAYVEIVLATGDVAAARAAADELAAIAAELGSPLLQARAAHAAGAVLLAEGDPKDALLELRARR